MADSLLGTTQVFPGGNYDEKQDDSFQMTAIRETFEETGLLLASESESESESGLPRSQSRWSPLSPPPSLSEAALDASRESVHSGRTLFRDFLKQHALTADVKALLPFTEWITPLGYSRCVQCFLLSLLLLLTLSHNNMLLC
jgi:8-oxo-dGTP pyrophosphatase MutT (NUDIX family)